MAIDKSRIREFPPISITISGEDGGELLIGSTRQAVTGASEIEVRRELLGLVVAHARTGGSTVRVTTRDQEGIGVLLISPEGEMRRSTPRPWRTCQSRSQPVPSRPGSRPPHLGMRARPPGRAPWARRTASSAS